MTTPRSPAMVETSTSSPSSFWRTILGRPEPSCKTPRLADAGLLPLGGLSVVESLDLGLSLVDSLEAATFSLEADLSALETGLSALDLVTLSSLALGSLDLGSLDLGSVALAILSFFSSADFLASSCCQLRSSMCRPP